MIYTIENDKIKVDIADKGGELQSIVLKEDGCEYLWQGDPQYWSGRAYNLFPICGRLFDGKYTYKGKTYEMNLHGFVRNTVMKAEKVEVDKITFLLIPDDTIKSQYPFDFELRFTYTLNGTEINSEINVVNTGNEDMFFGFGGHPGFNVPLTDGEKFEDYYLEFDCVKPMKRLIMTPLFYTDKTEPYPLRDGKIIDLNHSLFENDARFFTDMCKYVTLKSRKSSKSVRLEYPGMINLGIWHAPQSEAPYICIEPWCSMPSYDGKVDDLETKNQMTRLAPNKVYENGFKIIIS